MKKLGLIGFPLAHSFSKKYYEDKFEKEKIQDIHYDLFSLESISMFNEVLQIPKLIGVNVTIPYKRDIISFLDEISPQAQIIQAVNCIRITQQNGKPYLKGYNTDVLGFKNSLVPLLTFQHTAAMILGNGGAAQAVKQALKELEINYTVISRSPKTKNEYSYDQITEEMMQQHRIIINCSPLGTFPNINEKPNIPYQFVTKEHLFYDLIYNPKATLFLQLAKERGAKIKNGYEMLVLQAEENWKIWMDEK